MTYLNILLLVTILVYSYLRLCDNPKREILNPLMYITIFSALYYLLGGISAEVVNEILGLGISQESIFYSQLLSMYTVSIYLLFYIFSSNVKQKNYEFTLTKKQVWILKIIVSLITLFGIVFLLKNIGKVVELNRISSRVAALESYLSLVRGVPVGTLFFLQVTMLSLMYSAKKIGYGWFLNSLPVIIISLSSGSRTYLSVLFIAVFISSVYVHPNGLKTKLVVGFNCLILLLGSTFVGGDNFNSNIYSASAEFAHTYLTVPFMLDKELLGVGQTLEYYSNPLVKLFGLSTKITYFGEEIHKIMNTPISLAGNNITESLYYLGFHGAILYPFIISTLFLLMIILNDSNKKAFILIFMFCLYMRTFVRGAAYQSITMLLTYFLIFLFIFFVAKIIPSKKNEIR